MSKMIRKIYMDCPICDKVHEVEERKRNTKTLIKGVQVIYKETYFLCTNSEEDNEFVTGKMHNLNLNNARIAYAKQKGTRK